MNPYLTIKEAAEFLCYDEQTLRNKMSIGVFKLGVHYFKRRGQMSVRFKRAALEAWVECRDLPAESGQMSRSDNLLTLRRRQG